jgi:fructuronate reductase
MPRDLSRRRGDGHPAAPVRHVHLGLGNFFRAHQAWYTEHAPDSDEWGIAAFAGRGADLAKTLTAQDNLYTLVTRAETVDQLEIVSSVAASHPAGDHGRFLGYLASAQTALLTLTVTEAGYHRNLNGALDTTHRDVQADLAALRVDVSTPVRTIPGRIVAGLAARRAADVGSISIASCDNLPDNGGATARVVTQLAELVQPTLAGWIAESVSFVNTVVDRITPQLDPAELAVVAATSQRSDRAPVVTEPFSEWTISGQFPAGRPAWDQAGATFTDTIAPFEERKLWLLNGAHSLLAYAGSLRGHLTVAEAVDDSICRDWLDQWWREAAGHLDLPVESITAYQAALLSRFTNRRIHHHLNQIADDGSLKLAIRVLPVLRAEREVGRLPIGGLRIVAAWLCYLRRAVGPIHDPCAQLLAGIVSRSLDVAAREITNFLDEALGEDDDAVDAVSALAAQLLQS